MKTIKEYLEMRHLVVENNIADEVLSGNAVKLACERHAFAEIVGAQQALIEDDFIRKKAEEAPVLPTTSDYATALKIMDDYIFTNDEIGKLKMSEFRNYLKKRVKAETPPCLRALYEIN